MQMTMPGDIAFRSNDSYFGANSTAAVKNGEVTEDRVTLQDPINKHVDVQADHYKLVREMGAASTVLLKNPLEAPQQRAKQDHTTIGWWLNDWDTVGAANAAANKGAALVFVASDSGEQYITVDRNEDDRHNLTASNNILLWASRSSGLVFLDKSLRATSDPYTGGLLVDYRWFGTENIEPRYEFGLGLSYTTFEYSNLKVTRAEDALSKELIWWDGGVSGNKTGASIGAWLHDALFKVSFTVKNTGKVAGSEVAQMYINPPAGANEPPSVLRGFTKSTSNLASLRPSSWCCRGTT
ncbi:Glycoside hydrolase family 3 protein [Rhizoctonia solani]|uniref:beta-glucosidase n=1 Tax=Rhizoctonia solani TaxID=456999 RepID=A0A8H7I5M0_9AGAM|nr:Glycoside hydrolase family 3 protein [Rhizoctonia solani]